MTFGSVLANHVLLTGLAGWLVAQMLKIPIDVLHSKQWNWALFFAAGGMPSSHSALVTSTALAVGLHNGFDNALFGLAVTVAMVVVYDATGIRRQAGMQAKKINILVDELLKGHPISEQQLKEVLGHTPLEAFGGVLLGIAIALIFWLIFR